MNKETLKELESGSHIEISDGDTEVLATLEELSIKDFAALEVMSWLSSNKEDVVKNQAPFHIAGHKDRLPLRYSAPLEGVKKEAKSEGETAALAGIDALSQVTVEYLMGQPNIAKFIKDAQEILFSNGVEITDEQVDRLYEQIEILESLQADYVPISSTPRHSSKNNPFNLSGTDDAAPGFVHDDGNHTRGRDSAVAAELDGIPISDDRVIPKKVA